MRAAGGWRLARDAWRSASETVDAQIAALQRALRDTGDEDFARIAEFGLNGVTGDHKVKLMAAMMELGDGEPIVLQARGPKALAVVAAFRAHVEDDERGTACDENPFGVPIAIRATLGPPLAGLETALHSAAG